MPERGRLASADGAFVYLEIHRPQGLESFRLDSDRCTIGKAPTNDIVLEGDATASRTHAALEPYSGTWCVRDLGSMNGTFVNGNRVFAERALRDRDELTVGSMKLVFRAPMAENVTATTAPTPPPYVTRREREVLAALCRPTFKGDYFTEPAHVKGIAKELVVTEAAVKQHLSRLYDKFGIHEGEGERRVRLANEAMRRGAVSYDDLRKPPPDPRDDPQDTG
jgi:DNA-binding transcriptional ArsR family regulator